MWYTVQEGDSLSKIARRFNTTVDEIKKLNSLTSNDLSIGQKLLIKPEAGDQPSTTSQGPTTSPGPSQSTMPPAHGTIEKAQHFATLTEERKDLPEKELKIMIYHFRAAYFFMSKMALDLPRQGEKMALCAYDQNGKCIKHVQTRETPCIVMPQYTNWALIGDYAIVINTNNNKISYAIVGDWGPQRVPADETIYISPYNLRGRLGEGSYELGRRLQIKDINIGDGSKAFQPSGIFYVVIPNSGEGMGTIPSNEEIDKKGEKLLNRLGGIKTVKYLMSKYYNINIQI
ncbi:LysM peptidoglycan-binding domain-containing protein [Pseudobacteroides cellulosolvens]|uniref:Peptidoglycan-binding lysin domain-containing protein n=1 Tax=Pseudobacteroides cellulosolvens ATCC 35603 = DSM 2933 TaxID=398512 RepID=A0A0L6JIH3_9FIRM|nr:LysM peptidoglycan-binding domain-containing protein [Pseudobacteroides cellulosolvens]KNY25252.1 Peptidoglycan-binding lysin domain-containing protein [Pseudobacteroides cellulosolvens ATCC 35603 = DSM 2933]